MCTICTIWYHVVQMVHMFPANPYYTIRAYTRANTCRRRHIRQNEKLPINLVFHILIEFRYNSIMTVYKQFIEDYEKQVAGGLKSPKTLQKYKAVYKHLGDFLKLRYHLSDMALKEIKPSFISDFEIFLTVDRKLNHNSVCIYVKPIQMLLHRAQENGWVARYPFSDYKICREDPDKGFVTKEEMQLMMDCPNLNKKRTFIRDLFIFCCFTGVSYIDLKNMTHENIVINPADGSKWLHYRRQKTSVEANVKLLRPPQP